MMNKKETLNGETYNIEILCHAKIIKMPKEMGPGIPILDFVFDSEREAKDAITAKLKELARQKGLTLRNDFPF